MDEVLNLENAPAVSMAQYLLASDQQSLLTKVSVYSQRGTTREQARLLYMNATALAVWQAMGKQPALLDLRHRPPKTALLAFGVPFSE